MRDAVVPAQFVLVEEHPGVTHPRRDRGKIAGRHSPAAQRATGRSSVESGNFKACDAQPRSAGGGNDKQILDGRPEDARNPAGQPQDLTQWRPYGRHLPKNKTVVFWKVA